MSVCCFDWLNCTGVALVVFTRIVGLRVESAILSLYCYCWVLSAEVVFGLFKTLFVALD